MSNEIEPKSTSSQGVVYQIRLKGHLESQWTDWFEGLAVTLEENGETLLTGPLFDQAALHGLLKRVRDLGMPLVSVSPVEPRPAAASHVKSIPGAGGMSEPRSITTRRNKMNAIKENPPGTGRTTAVIVGVLYIIGTAAGVLGMVVGGRYVNATDPLKLAAANAGQVGLVALLVLVMGLPLAMVPAMMYPILKRHNEALAIGYVIFRGALESLTYIGLAMCWLLLALVARQYGVSGAAAVPQFSSLGTLLLKGREPILWIQDIVFGLGGLMFYCQLYQTRLIPRWISGWGFLAAMPYMTAGLIAVFTGAHLVPMLLPLALQEMVMAVWLIAKGFTPAAIASLSSKRPTNGLLSAA